MFLPIVGIAIASALLVKRGMLAVWVGVMALALKLCLALIALLSGTLLWKTIKK
jgi:hypothetical protein